MQRAWTVDNYWLRDSVFICPENSFPCSQRPADRPYAEYVRPLPILNLQARSVFHRILLNVSGEQILEFLSVFRPAGQYTEVVRT